VLSVGYEHPRADPDSIIDVMGEDLGELSHQGVYDVYGALIAAGLVSRSQPSGSVARDTSRVGDNPRWLGLTQAADVHSRGGNAGHRGCSSVTRAAFVLGVAPPRLTSRASSLRQSYR
jgi:hypothetical protein